MGQVCRDWGQPQLDGTNRFLDGALLLIDQNLTHQGDQHHRKNDKREEDAHCNNGCPLECKGQPSFGMRLRLVCH